MRYFLKTSVTQPLTLAGFTFEFEPVAIRGGSWFGVLAVEDDSAANALAEYGMDVGEITQARYESEKKKTIQASLSVPEEQLKQLIEPALPPLAEPATSHTNRISDDVASLGELTTTDQSPPREPLIDDPPPKRRGRPGRPSVKAA